MPNLPQLALLPALVERLWTLPDVQAVYLGGSFSRGAGDAYSDLDLQVVAAARPDRLFSLEELTRLCGDAPLVLKRFLVPRAGWMHHFLLPSGAIVDLMLRDRIEAAEAETLVPLRNAEDVPELAARPWRPSAAWEPQEISREGVQHLMQTFWLVAHKHRKCFARSLDLAAWAGLQLSSAQLLRLQFILHTGRDCGDPARKSIYELTALARCMQDAGGHDACIATLRASQRADGMACVTEIVRLGAEVCRQLRQRWQIAAFPELEAVVTSAWQRFAASRPDG